ncbi:MAG: hypothetical protein ACLPZM_08465 [Thermoplasmata archaeon]
MVENPAPESPGPHSRFLVWWTNHSHRYVIPIVGAASVTLGISLAVDSNVPWRTYTPPLLVLVGAGTLASGIVALAIRRWHAARAAAQAAAKWASAPPFFYNVEDEERAMRSRTPVPARRAASADFSINIPSQPGEYLWRSWASASTHLLVDLVGPVGETAYMPAGMDEPALHEEGEPIFLNTPSGPSRGGGPMSSSIGNSSAFSGVAPVPARAMAADSGISTDLLDGTDTASYRNSLHLPGPRVMSPVHHEALNPTPPHLRPRPSPAPAVAPGRPFTTSPIPRGIRCATCHTAVTDPPKWRRCLDCQRHLCAECVVDALLTYQRGWCTQCAVARNPEFVSSSALPRQRRKTDDTYAPSADETELPVTGLAS